MVAKTINRCENWRWLYTLPPTHLCPSAHISEDWALLHKKLKTILRTSTLDFIRSTAPSFTAICQLCGSGCSTYIWHRSINQPDNQPYSDSYIHSFKLWLWAYCKVVKTNLTSLGHRLYSDDHQNLRYNQQTSSQIHDCLPLSVYCTVENTKWVRIPDITVLVLYKHLPPDYIVKVITNFSYL